MGTVGSWAFVVCKSGASPLGPAVWLGTAAGMDGWEGC